jgi:hypothetical protein
MGKIAIISSVFIALKAKNGRLGQSFAQRIYPDRG